MEYSGKIKKMLKKTEEGDLIEVKKGKEFYTGSLIPKSSGSENTVIIKLGNGYNIGIIPDKIKLIKKKAKGKETRKNKIKKDNSKKTISVLHTGGTLTSRIDYDTGGVTSITGSAELLEAIPELKNISNIDIVSEMHIATDDIEPEHWTDIARNVMKEVRKGTDGVIIMQGTDFMHYTAIALSFMLENINIPVILVGSQRSGDRGSSDAAMNLICSANFIANSDFAGIGLCMHGTISDDFCLIHQGTRVRKMHTSRRDSFRSIDVLPIAKVNEKQIEFLRNDYKKRENENTILKDKFEKKIAIVKMRPGFSYKEMEFYEKSYKGIVIEGSGLGHMPVNVSDNYTKHHEKLFKCLERMTKKGIIILMTSQCPYGKVNMNVYSPGRKLKEAGIMPVAMMPETAYVKLGWALGNTKTVKEAKELIMKNVAGEILEISDPRTFLM